MTTYPGLPGPEIGAFLTRESSRDHYDQGTEFHIGQIEMVGNTGTYLDTPFHRFSDGYDLADLDLAVVAGVPGVCLEVDVQEVTTITAAFHLMKRRILRSMSASPGKSG